MVPCHVCGKDAAAGWVAGFPPAPDSMKLGLCPDHDTEQNRENVFVLWQKLLSDRIDVKRLEESHFTLQNFQVTVLFLAGGSMSFLCEHHAVTAQGTL